MRQTTYTQPDVSTRHLWLDYLRSFLTVLVVAHHSSLAYTTFAYFDQTTYINSTTPVVDAQRWIGMDIFENFNDIFFMSLMFLISGLFVVKSMQKKGRGTFVVDRFKRLMIPFLIAVTFIIPLAYIPSYYIIHHTFSLPPFIRDYVAHQQWPVGPPWFIWLLFTFNLVAVLIPAAFYTRISQAVARLAQKPLLWFGIAFLIVSIAFIPISLWVGQYTWTGFGPFDFQVNRLFLYWVFFLFGVGLGSVDWETYLFTHNRFLNQSWIVWCVLCLLAYVLVEIFTYYGMAAVRAGKMTLTKGYFIFDLLFVASCLASSFAFLALFKQKITRLIPLWSDLSANAFGIYLIHYVLVTWLQFALLPISLPVIVKFLVVFLGSLLGSWILIRWARKIQLIHQML